MPLWTDIITPVEATGIARVELQDRERAKGALSRFLPNVSVADDHVKFIKGQHGLVDEAYYRAYNAAPEIISSDVIGSTLIELAAMSNNQPIDERTQKALRRMPEGQVRKSIEWAIRRAAWSIADRNERTRGQVIHTGKALANQHNFLLNDDFGRNAALSFTAPALWSDPATDRMSQLDTWLELYATHNGGERPGTILMSDAAFAAFARGAQFRTVLVGGATRMPMAGEVNSIIEAAGYPTIEKYNRSTKSGLVLRRSGSTSFRSRRTRSTRTVPRSVPRSTGRPSRLSPRSSSLLLASSRAWSSACTARTGFPTRSRSWLTL